MMTSSSLSCVVSSPGLVMGRLGWSSLDTGDLRRADRAAHEGRLSEGSGRLERWRSPFRFRLTRQPPAGKWNAATYALQKTTSDDDGKSTSASSAAQNRAGLN
jgi:hypothetical protein